MRLYVPVLAVLLSAGCDALAGTPPSMPPPPGPRPAPAGAPGGPRTPTATPTPTPAPRPAANGGPGQDGPAPGTDVDPWVKSLGNFADQVPEDVRAALEARVAARDTARRAEAKALAAARVRLLAELHADPASADARKLGKDLADRERASLAAERAFGISFLSALPQPARVRFKAEGDLGRLVVDPTVGLVEAVRTPLPATLVSQAGGGDRLVDPLAAARWRLSAAATPVDDALSDLRSAVRDATLDDPSIAVLDKRLAGLTDAVIAFQAAKLDQLAWLRTVLPLASTRALLDQVTPEDFVQVVGPQGGGSEDGLASAMLGAKDPVAANEAAVAANWEVGTRQLPLEETTTPIQRPSK